MQQAIGKYRWTICGLLFFATTINYIDRSVISFLKSTFTDTLHWDDADYANVELAFKISYAVGLLFAGRFIDKIGTKAGYALALIVWSFASMGHAFVKTIFGFISARSVLGVSEAGNFPAAIKTVAEWFPKKERAFATGIFNSGANVGAIAAPLTVPFIVKAWG
ncbi:MAG TPA: MFS transporter, partial [Chitinophagaceae bacterium]